MIIQLTLREGGEWWAVDIPNVDPLKNILNTGTYNGTKVYAVMVEFKGLLIIYDCLLKMWR